MVELAGLERRIRVLEDIEAIKELKAKYWRCVDNKLFDELAADCFTGDGTFEVVGYGVELQGRKAIAQFLSQSMGESVVSVHHGHNPEIEITSDTTAKGRWALYNPMHDVPANSAVTIWGFYEDEYSKEEGKWKMKSTRITPAPLRGMLTMQPSG